MFITESSSEQVVIIHSTRVTRNWFTVGSDGRNDIFRFFHAPRGSGDATGARNIILCYLLQQSTRLPHQQRNETHFRKFFQCPRVRRFR